MKDYRHPILLHCGASLWTAASIGLREQCPQDIGGQEEEKNNKTFVCWAALVDASHVEDTQTHKIPT